MLNSLHAFALRLFIAIALVSAALVANDHYDAVSIPEKLNLHFLWLALVFNIVYLVVETVAWQRLLVLSVGKAISLAASFTHVSMLLAGKYLPGKVWGMFARGYHLARLDVSPSQSIRATYLEALISTHAGVCLGVLLWMLSTQARWQWLAWFAAVSSVPVVFVLHHRLVPVVKNPIAKWWSAARGAMSFGRLRLRGYTEMFVIYMFDWASIGALSICLYLAFIDAPLTLELACLLLGANALGMIAGFFAVFAPAGLGVREGVMAAVLVQMMPLADAGLLVVMLRVWLTVADVVCGGTSLLLFSRVRPASGHS